jgi:hypothetical protein
MSNASAPEDQDLGIVEVRFDPTGSADIVIENIGGSFLSLPAERTSLCNGADNCIFLVEGDSLTLLPDNRVTRTLPNTRASGGELGIFTADPFADFSFAYIAWGSGAGSSSLEAQAISSAALWTSGARIAIEPDDTGFVCTGDATNPASFVSCNPD